MERPPAGTIPAILNEPIRIEWGLNDLQLGIIAAAFTVIYAVAGLPLGRLADRGSRKKVIGWGVAALFLTAVCVMTRQCKLT